MTKITKQGSCSEFLYNLLLERSMDKIPSNEWWHVEKGLDWPAPKDATFERLVGAVLVQNTSWHNNASRAMENLKKLGILEPLKMLKTNSEV